MEKRTDGELRQRTKRFNSRLWIGIISVVLVVSIVAIACLGAALSASNDRIAELQADMNDADEKYEALDANKKAADSEIDALQSSMELTNEEIETLNAELSSLKDELAQSKKTAESLENSLSALENANQSALGEIDQLKSDLKNANDEIAGLKEQQKEPEDKIRIYIDQGHNPAPHHNTGASGNGLDEQDVTFLVGCLLADLLRSDGRFEVQLSRPNKSVVLGTDNKSSLMARVEGAAAFEADYLISLHTNAFGQDTANGIEVYAAVEGSESYVFGESLLKGLIESTNLRDRGMKLEPDFDVLEYSTMPAVLVEMGFISNPTDAALLSKKPDLFAKGMYNGILDYFGLMQSSVGET